MEAFRICVAAAWVLALSSCDKPSPTPSAPSVSQARFAELERRVNLYGSQLIQERLQENRSALLQPSSDGFRALESNIGLLTVSIQDVGPYADGSRVVIRIGNPTSADITDYSVKLGWGTADSKGVPDFDNQLSKNEEISVTIPAGAFHLQKFDLAKIPPSKFGFITLSEFTVLSLTLIKPN